MAIGLLGKGWATYEGLMCVLANSYSEELRTSFNAASISGLLLRKLISRKGKDQATGEGIGVQKGKRFFVITYQSLRP